MRNITVPAGIGDGIWLLQKLINTGEKFNFYLPGGNPRRGKQIYDLLPQVAASAQYMGGLSYKLIEKRNVQNVFKKWSQIGQHQFYLSCNKHLEEGKRLETFLPDLPVKYCMDWQTTIDDRLEAERFTPRLVRTSYPSQTEKLIGIYCSSYAGSKNWGTWTAKEWIELVQGMYDQDRRHIFILIGAEWDVDMTGEVKDGLIRRHIPFAWTIGARLGVVIEILKRLDYFIGFPSGLSILNETLGKRTFMFYATQIQRIINTWADPERIASGDCKECLFCPPEQALSWIFNDYKLLDKI